MEDSCSLLDLTGMDGGSINDFVLKMEEHIAVATMHSRLVVIFMVMINKDIIL